MDNGQPSPGPIWVCALGTVPYREAFALQESLHARRLAGELPDLLLLLEHPPVYTRGRRSAEGELTLGEGFYRARGIEVVPTNRGGRVTYHGPGQLVGYPIMAVRDVVSHLRTMEDAIVAALVELGVAARSRPEDGADYTGVWVGPRKIASLGVHVSRGVSTHGFAVNVSTDLEPFSWIVACGLPSVEMTSVLRELPTAGRRGRSEGPTAAGRSEGPASSLARARVGDSFREHFIRRFCAAHGRPSLFVSRARLGIEPSEAPPRSRGRTPRAHSLVAGLTRADAPQLKEIVSL
jgi:lipoyl(octanoyl) transferase